MKKVPKKKVTIPDDNIHSDNFSNIFTITSDEMMGKDACANKGGRITDCTLRQTISLFNYAQVSHYISTIRHSILNPTAACFKSKIHNYNPCCLFSNSTLVLCHLYQH